MGGDRDREQQRHNRDDKKKEAPAPYRFLRARESFKAGGHWSACFDFKIFLKKPKRLATTLLLLRARLSLFE